jgi:ribosomal protein S18 acetylase RimI-like enzyme
MGHQSSSGDGSYKSLRLMSFHHETIRIVPAAMELVESYRQCVGCVARERKWLAIVEEFPLEETRRFVAKNIRDNNPAFFAVETPLANPHSLTTSSRVVGWADTRRTDALGSQHRVELGMGVHPDFRRRGLGEQLLQAVIDAANAAGFMRLELSVYTSNVAAWELYKKLGFVEEGRMIKGRYLDGHFDDVIRMAMIFRENMPAKGK